MHPSVAAYFTTTSDAASFINGFTKGLTGEDLGSDFVQCLTESYNIVEEVEISITTFENGDIAGMVNSIFRMVNVLNEIPLVLSDCQ